MSKGTIVQAVRRERAELALRWLGQFAVNRAALGHQPVAVDEALCLGLLDDFLVFLDLNAASPAGKQSIHAIDLTRVVGFPDNIVVMLDLLQAGVQVLGAFAVENAGLWAAWTIAARNQFLGELDAVFPLLVRREVGALCDRFFASSAPRDRGEPNEMRVLSVWARTIAQRN